MIFKVGDTVVYPHHGAALIEAIETRTIKGEQKDIAFGSQIRSYVFMPYTLVKDVRTGYESGNVSAVMDGDLDGFINAYLKAASQGKLSDATDDDEL